MSFNLMGLFHACYTRLPGRIVRYSRKVSVLGSRRDMVVCQGDHGVRFPDGEQLWKDITTRYDSAQGMKASSFTDTVTEVVEDGGFSYILKIACRLKDKPKAPKDRGAWKNPFLPPDEDLYVCQLSDTHSLVLNKFNITAHHVIVITNAFVRQETPLTADDFAATCKVVESMPGDGGMAFFNCGPISGASQPHKHIQCIPLPIAETVESVAVDPPFDAVIQHALTGKKAFEDVLFVEQLPFVHGIIKVDMSEQGIVFEKGYTRVLEYIEKLVRQRHGSSWARTDSYNMIMTKHYMMIVPRQAEYFGSVGCNSMGFAGSFFLATQEDIDHVKRFGPTHVLSHLGFSSSMNVCM